MFSKDTRCELCCLLATCLGVGAFVLIIFALDFAEDAANSELRLLLIIAAGIALALMVVLTYIATRLNQRASR